MLRFSHSTLVCAGLAVFGLGMAQAATLTAYLSPPGEMSTDIAGAITETFDAPSLLAETSNTYTSLLGTYVGNGAVLPVIEADQFGGADGSDYMYVGTRNQGDSTIVTLTLNAPADYFGFWWSAGDSTNRISVYRQGVLVAQFTTGDITKLLAGSPIYALNPSTTYATAQFYGNPSPGFLGQDDAEPFAYVNLVANGFTFDTVVFDNTTSSGFENDNNSVYSGAVNIPDTFVKVADVPFRVTPEPGYAMLVGLLLAGAAGWKLRANHR